MAYLDPLKNEFRQFLANPFPRNKWIECKVAKIYIRKAEHFLEGECFECIDIANIEVMYPGRGYGKKIFEFIELAVCTNIIFVENVFNPILRGMLERRKYKYYYFSGDELKLFPSMYKIQS